MRVWFYIVASSYGSIEPLISSTPPGNSKSCIGIGASTACHICHTLNKLRRDYHVMVL